MGNMLGGGGEAQLSLGGGSLGGSSKAPSYSRIGYSLVGGGALDCVESIGKCPEPQCSFPGQKWVRFYIHFLLVL